MLKAIAGLLRPGKGDTLNGTISYNGRTLQVRNANQTKSNTTRGKLTCIESITCWYLKDKGEFHIENAFAYIDQLDKHAPRFTVEETFQFAQNCKGLRKFNANDTSIPQKALKANIPLQVTLRGLGLYEVKDTFVGDTDVRGVSGGQRRRVTVGEMLGRASVLCGDEISTGLDASSTFDMVQLLVYFGKLNKYTRIFSLLQPSPETVSLFDEVLVLAEGHLIYAGPVELVDDYFAAVGFKCPQFTDVADFLQMVSTEDGKVLYDPKASFRDDHLGAPSAEELAEIFRDSDLGERIQEQLASPPKYVWDRKDSSHDSLSSSQVSSLAITERVKNKYQNNFVTSAKLNLKRFFVLWTRDKRVIFAGAAKNIIMGLSVGGCYLSTTNSIQIQGALFQAVLFIQLGKFEKRSSIGDGRVLSDLLFSFPGAMQSASALIRDRIIFYKHYDANFYSAPPFMLGRTLSQIPQVRYLS